MPCSCPPWASPIRRCRGRARRRGCVISSSSRITGSSSTCPRSPPGGTVTTTLAPPSHYPVAKDAEISLWSDEGAVEHRSASNWASDQSAGRRQDCQGRAPRPGARPLPAMTTPAHEFTPAPRTTNRRARSSSPFAVGSVWKGTSRRRTQQGEEGDPTNPIHHHRTRRRQLQGEAPLQRPEPGDHRRDHRGRSRGLQIRVRGQLGLPHSGRVTGTRMDVTYSGPGSDDTVEGTMVLNHVR